MDIFIFIISAIVLYPVIGTMFGILLTLYNVDNLKLKIFLLTAFRPLAYTSILGLIFPSTFNNSLIWLACFFIAVVLRDIIFGSQRYLSKLTVTNEKISIEYINSFLRTKDIEFAIDEIKHLDLSEMKSIIDYPPSLTFTDNDDKTKFTILSKTIWACTNQTVNAATIGIPNSGQTI